MHYISSIQTMSSSRSILFGLAPLAAAVVSPSSTFPRPTKDQMVGVFRKYVDVDKNGLFSPEEIVEFTDSLLDQERALDSGTEMAEWDVDQDGKLSLDEVLTGLSLDNIEESLAQNDELVRFFEDDRMGVINKFKAADKDGDDKLNVQELQFLIYPSLDAAVLQVEVEHQIRAKDRNGDGLVSFKEFREMPEDEKLDSDVYYSELAEFRIYDRDQNEHLDYLEVQGMVTGHAYQADRVLQKFYHVILNQKQ